MKKLSILAFLAIGCADKDEVTEPAPQTKNDKQGSPKRVGLGQFF